MLHKLGSNVATKNLPTSCYTGIGPLLKVLLLTKTGTLQGTADYLLPNSLLHKLGSNVATKNLPTSCYTGIGPLLKVLLLTGQRLIATSVPTRCYETTDRSTHETLNSLLRSHIALRHLALNSRYFSGN